MSTSVSPTEAGVTLEFSLPERSPASIHTASKTVAIKPTPMTPSANCCRVRTRLRVDFSGASRAPAGDACSGALSGEKPAESSNSSRSLDVKRSALAMSITSSRRRGRSVRPSRQRKTVWRLTPSLRASSASLMPVRLTYWESSSPKGFTEGVASNVTQLVLEVYRPPVRMDTDIRSNHARSPK